ncbi:hypothetical protein KY308_03325 [Candidatus Woesearchaeota archaeon]|nr:hypothetical protein [Candidatus Woesearchaeota archaeon]
MKTEKIIFILTLICIAIFVGGCAEKTETVKTSSQQQSQPSQSTAQAPSSQSSPSKTVEVDIRSAGFRPETVEIPIGGCVKWTNSDSADHSVQGPTFPMTASTDPKTSGRLQPGESWTKCFGIEGYFSYVDVYNDELRGKVVVQ